MNVANPYKTLKFKQRSQRRDNNIQKQSNLVINTPNLRVIQNQKFILI